MCAHQVAPYVHLVSTDDRTTESTTRQSDTADGCLPRYEIRVSGHLGKHWATWFDGMTLTARDDGTTVVRGPVVDQAALHGLLQKLRDLGVDLLSLSRTVPGHTVEPPVPTHEPTPHRSPGESS